MRGGVQRLTRANAPQRPQGQAGAGGIGRVALLCSGQRLVQPRQQPVADLLFVVGRNALQCRAQA